MNTNKLKTQSASRRTKLKTFTVLFVCSGNSCRSPMAKGIFDKIVQDNKNDKVKIISLSAGTSAVTNQLPNELAQASVKKYGADIKHHLSAPLTKERIEIADLILTMEQKHKNNVIEILPQAKNKVFVITEYVGDSQDGISDPLGQPEDKYVKTADILYDILKKVYKKIKTIGR